jgi:hypothetical protein
MLPQFCATAAENKEYPIFGVPHKVEKKTKKESPM